MPIIALNIVSIIIIFISLYYWNNNKETNINRIASVFNEVLKSYYFRDTPKGSTGKMSGIAKRRLSSFEPTFSTANNDIISPFCI